MDARKNTSAAGVPDSKKAVTRVGPWYASGPEDRSFVAGDPAFSILRVMSDDAAVPGCVTASVGEQPLNALQVIVTYWSPSLPKT